MNEFKIIEINDISYLKEFKYESLGEQYENEYKYFHEDTKNYFLQEVEKCSDIRRQAGYSKVKSCNYLALILIVHKYGDGEFNGHIIKSTYLINQNGKITDSNNNREMYGEVSSSIRELYHVLPNGSLIEYKVGNYEDVDELKEIYKNITKIRGDYTLFISLDKKRRNQKS